MSDIRLFRTSDDTAEELKGSAVTVEKSLQKLIEKHLEAFLGIRFLASEYQTGKVHSGRIDTLGIDENGFPVIIEYKRATNENVINQGLFYLDWLMDHKAEYQLLVMNSIGKEQADRIEWSSPRLLCIAGGFTNYDEHAVKQIPRSIELIRYRRYSDGFLLLELMNAVPAIIPPSKGGEDHKVLSTIAQQGHLTILSQAPVELRELFESLKSFLLSLGNDVQMRSVQQYVAFRRIRNFVGVQIRPQAKLISVWPWGTLPNLPMDPALTTAESGSGIRIILKSEEDFAHVQTLLIHLYENG